MIQLVYDSENRPLEAVPRPLENGNDRQEEVLRGTEGAGPMDGTEAHVNFDTPAVLRKWPSLYKQRRTEGTGPYLTDGRDGCGVGPSRTTGPTLELKMRPAIAVRN